MHVIPHVPCFIRVGCYITIQPRQTRHACGTNPTLRYLQEKWKASGRKEIDFGEDLLPAVRPEGPQQPNGDDCGVYVIRYAKASSKEQYATL